MIDVGFTHVALHVRDLDASARFYSKYANLEIIHRRNQSSDPTKKIGWLSDGTRPFALVLAETDEVEGLLRPFAHLGVACATRDKLDVLCGMAEQEGILRQPVKETSGPAGSYAMLDDPDGHTLELSYGQELGYEVGNYFRQ